MTRVQQDYIEMLLAAELALESPARGLPLHEALTKTDKEEIEVIVRKGLRSPLSQGRTLKIVKNVLGELSRVMYARRGFWLSQLSGTSGF